MFRGRGMTRASSNSRQTIRSQNWRGRGWSVPTHQLAALTGKFVTTASLHGGKKKVPSNPPDVTYQPWNNITLIDSFNPTNGVKTWQVKDVVKILTKQIDPTGHAFRDDVKDSLQYPIIQFKLSEVHTWNLTGRMIAFSATDFIDTTPGKSDLEQLCGIVDTGAVGTTPAIGYQYSSAHRSHVLRNDGVSSDVYLFNVQAGTADNCIVYIKISYKFDGPVKIPQLMTLEYVQKQQLLHQATIESNTAKSQETLQKTAGVLRNIKGIMGSAIDKLPDTAKKVIDGVEVATLLVTALADNEGFEIVQDANINALSEAVMLTNVV